MVLTGAVIFLFIKVHSGNVVVPEENKQSPDEKTSSAPAVRMPGNAPTGHIAFVNIDRLNEESLEIRDLFAESKKRKTAIESSLESISAQYQKKMEDYQTSAKAGIAPESEMKAKEREIMGLQKEAESKQLQMENLQSEVNEQNGNFQKTVRGFLQRWNGGKYDYILSYSETVPTMLIGNTSLEITEQVIKGLNSEYINRKNKK